MNASVYIDMARTSLQDSIYRVSVHKNGGYSYASTHPFELDENGVRRYRYLHWGTVTEEKKFIPGKAYFEASPEMRQKLIFPKDWDLSEIGERSTFRYSIPYLPEDRGRLFGDVWFLDSIVQKLGIREDLYRAFGCDLGKTDDILTLAYFPYLTGYNYSRISRWQKLTRTPSRKEFDVDSVNAVSASVLGREMELFMGFRTARNPSQQYIIVDSISRSAYGESLSDQKWGQKKARLHLRQTVEFVVYDKDAQPLFYMAQPGGVQDSNSLGTSLASLEKRGYTDSVLVSDRGYESLANMDKYILMGQRMVLCVNVMQGIVLDRILSLGEDVSRSSEMTMNRDSRRYNAQFDLDYIARDDSGTPVPVRGMKLNVFFNAQRQQAEREELDVEIASQREALESILSSGQRLDDDKALRRNYSWYDIVYDSRTRTILSFSLNSDKVEKARRTAGFFANVTVGLDIDSMQAMGIYSMKYDQEKLLQQVRGLMDFEKRFDSSKDVKSGLMLILFLDLVLGSYVRRIWYGSDLRQKYRSPMDVIDQMHPIFCRQADDGGCIPSEMDDEQRHICEVFALAIDDK